jgi:hypothetical protein
MAVSADWLGTCSSTPRQHQGAVAEAAAPIACSLVSRDPVLQLTGTNKGESPSSSTVPASPRIAQQHVNSAVNTAVSTRRRARLHSSLEPGFPGRGELDSRSRAWPVKNHREWPTTLQCGSTVVAIICALSPRTRHYHSMPQAAALFCCLERDIYSYRAPGSDPVPAPSWESRDPSSNT